MSSGSSSPLDDALNCQVCFEPFVGRILMCKMGHAVCESCHDKLPVCPQCRSNFTGTRNYLMEELLAKLQKLIPEKMAAAKKKSGKQQNKPGAGTSNGSAEPELDPVAAEQLRRKKEKLKERKRKKKEALAASKAEAAAAPSSSSSAVTQPAAVTVTEPAQSSTGAIKKKAKHAAKAPETVNEPSQQVGGMTSVVVADVLDPVVKECVDQNMKALKDMFNIKSPAQPSGFFPCHMLSCFEQFIPICRILNHIRYHHKEFFTQTSSSALDMSATFNLEIPMKSYRHSIHIRDFGLFTLFVDVDKDSKKDSGGQTVHAWVQIFGTRKMAKSFLFDLEVTAGNVKASFSDLCYHGLVDEILIISKKQCLTMSGCGSSCRKLQIKLTLSRNLGRRTRKRNSETVLSLSSPQDTAQPTTSSKSGKKKNKKRHH